MKSRLMIAAMLVLLSGGGHSFSQGFGVTHPEAQPVPFPPASLDMTCTEVAVFYTVDAKAAAKVVPRGYTVKLNPDDTATLGLVTQDCSNILLNNLIPTGKAGFVHAWVAIEGPFEIDPVPGAAETWPTMYWYSFRDQTDNLVLAAAATTSGVNVEVIEGLTLGGTEAGIRQGSAVERRHPEVAYGWEERSQALPVTPIGINHRFYRNQVGRLGPTVVQGKVRCTIQLYGQGQSILTADHRSLIGDMGLATPLYGTAFDFTMGCKADLQTQSAK